MQLDPKLSHDKANSAGQYYQVFRRFAGKGVRPLQETGVSKSDQLMVSAMDKPLLALAMGSVVEVSSTSISLMLDRYEI